MPRTFLLVVGIQAGRNTFSPTFPAPYSNLMTFPVFYRWMATMPLTQLV